MCVDFPETENKESCRSEPSLLFAIEKLDAGGVLEIRSGKGPALKRTSKQTGKQASKQTG